jgi:hypothetical protein
MPRAFTEEAWRRYMALVEGGPCFGFTEDGELRFEELRTPTDVKWWRLGAEAGSRCAVYPADVVRDSRALTAAVAPATAAKR